MHGHSHAVVWLDHHEARVTSFSSDAAEESTIHPAHPPRHLHVRAGSPSGLHLRGDDAFFGKVAASLTDARAILVVGPSSAKTEFVTYLHRHAPALFGRISSVETMARISDEGLLAAARRHFRAADRMTPQTG